MSIISSKLQISPTAIYTSTGTSVATLMYFCNLSGNTEEINIWVANNGAPVGANNWVYSNVAITSQDTLVIDSEKLILDNGDAIYANCTTANVIATTINFIGL